jgi:hypothetical protein
MIALPTTAQIAPLAFVTNETSFSSHAKTGGVSVKRLLETHCPDLILDYDTWYRHRPTYRTFAVGYRMLRPKFSAQKTVIYGHFYPIKYLGFYGTYLRTDQAQLYTILRDPLERLISHYNFFSGGPFQHWIWRKMKKEAWDFKRFALGTEIRNFYSSYFSLIPIERFAYVGLTATIDTSVCKILGSSPDRVGWLG